MGQIENVSEFVNGSTQGSEETRTTSMSSQNQKVKKCYTIQSQKLPVSTIIHEQWLVHETFVQKFVLNQILQGLRPSVHAVSGQNC